MWYRASIVKLGETILVQLGFGVVEFVHGRVLKIWVVRPAPDGEFCNQYLQVRRARDKIIEMVDPAPECQVLVREP